MQVILLERVEKLGQMGQVVTVKSGYARNFLLPKKKAMRASKTNLSYFEQQKAQLEAANLKRKEEATYVAQKMEGARVTLIRQASETGLLYGSVRASDIAKSLIDAGFTVTRSQIELTSPIKMLGKHQAKVVLHPEVSVTVDVCVAQSEEEAQAQIETEA
ncbi:MAG TPA: 50S ribosomal protein L9 [Candidatus Nitrosotenuis sp.]|jgi:large subunit ribosomal protein L9|nr:50S ribosomal protein L9 [Candidatus Nitrosotenuis sp.]